jgi:dsDNA-specific endonuclease/ATPase MutS2
MPSDETRRVLRTFGVAVTTYEDAVEAGAPADEIDKAEAEYRTTLSEVRALIERLRAKRNNLAQQKSEAED